jgi:HAE1 family hydrophobic/amphiphilic exporter-1
MVGGQTQATAKPEFNRRNSMWMTKVSINNPVFATMVMAALMVLGLFSYKRLAVDQMPDISIPVAVISIPYAGASAEAVEQDVVRPIEDRKSVV